MQLIGQNYTMAVKDLEIRYGSKDIIIKVLYNKLQNLHYTDSDKGLNYKEFCYNFMKAGHLAANFINVYIPTKSIYYVCV